MNRWLVFLEQREGVVKQASIDIWNRVQELAALRHGSAVSGILAGPADTGQLDGSLSGTGVLYHAGDEGFRLYNPERYARIVTDLLKKEACNTIFFADTVLSRDLAPRLSVRLGASLLSGCSIFDDTWVDDGCRRSIYSGSAIASFAPECSLRIYTTTPSGTTRMLISSGASVSFIALEPSPCTSEDLVSVVSRMVMREGVPDVAEAAIIVAGGRGVGGAEGFVLLEQLARLLGGAVGASRAAVDEGMRPHAEQIGQTGKTVAPALYFACGISGALQHLAGIGSAALVVAINSDQHAPIFDVADYGLVGDIHQILPTLLEALQENLKKK
jgi:electron transfer flavoprotein alpha subunit